MPYLQPWLDPDTGATYSQTLVVSAPPQIDYALQRATLSTLRYASAAAYSLGFNPLNRIDTHLTGTAYSAWFSQVRAPEAALQAALIGASDMYIGVAAFLSGASPVGAPAPAPVSLDATLS